MEKQIRAMMCLFIFEGQGNDIVEERERMTTGDGVCGEAESLSSTNFDSKKLQIQVKSSTHT